MPKLGESQIDFRSVHKECANCGDWLSFGSSREVGRKKYCSAKCKNDAQKGRAPATHTFREGRLCQSCGIDYIAVAKKQKYCSARCNNRMLMRAFSGKRNTLEGHVKRLLVYKPRRHLSLEFILTMFEKQHGRCALTGIEMTWAVGSGRVRTNLSIDRISSDRGYEADNIQLVCRIANLMKNNLEQNEFVGLCRKVAELHNAK